MLCAVMCSIAAFTGSACSSHEPDPTEEPNVAEARSKAASTQHCDSDLASIVPVLGDTMDSVYAINYEVADRVTSQGDLIEGSREALFRISGMWRDLGSGGSELVQNLFNGIGDAWELGTSTAMNDQDGAKRNLLAIASAYDALAIALDACELWVAEADRLRLESSNLNQFAAALP